MYLQKKANILSFVKAVGNGFLSHNASILGGKLGTGGMLNLLGKLFGAHTKSVVDPATGKLVKKLLPMDQLHGASFLNRIGQRLGLAGDKLTNWTNKLHNNYMQSVRDVTGSEQNWKGRLLRFGLIGPAAIAAPMAYAGWGDKAENSDKLLAQPAKAINTAWHYGNIPGLALTGISKGTKLYSDSLKKSTLDGAAIASKLINYELANQPRSAYLAGVVNPALFAGKTDESVQRFLQQLNNINLTDN